MIMVGTIIIYREQRYECIGSEPHTNRDGKVVELFVLATNCPECGEPFTCKVVEREVIQPVRRCAQHRGPRPVKRQKSLKSRTGPAQVPQVGPANPRRELSGVCGT